MNKRHFLSGLGLGTAAVLAASLTTHTVAGVNPDTATWDALHAAYAQARDHTEAEVVDQALALADTYLQRNPKDGRALTYRGSLAAMRARVSWMPWKKLGMLHEGINQMDDGLTLVTRAGAPGEVEIDARMVRGITSARIPATFGRGGVATSDFKAIVKHPHFASISAEHRATALAWLAVMNKRQGQQAEADRLRSEAEAVDAAAARKVWEQAA